MRQRRHRGVLAVLFAVNSSACGSPRVAVLPNDPLRTDAGVAPVATAASDGSAPGVGLDGTPQALISDAAVPTVDVPVVVLRTHRPQRAEPERVGAVALTGCPPPPDRPARTSHPPPWRPTVLIPESKLPIAVDPGTRTASIEMLNGPGVWIWRVRLCEAGDPVAIVERARAAGMRQLWVRVGDSHDGFYAAAVLETLVSRAHAAGIAVIGWGFPYLWDPVSDAAWGRAALDWKSADGHVLDGFSPDIETSSEGVRLTPKRVAVYLGLLQPTALASHRPLIATVFRPAGRRLRTYPYAIMAPYIDAFAPMVYWGCGEPGAAAEQSVNNLKTLAPVHVIGQGYSMGDEGGRVDSPSAAEITRFCDAARRAGAVGASLWHWQDMTADEWTALSDSWWTTDVDSP